LHRASALFFCAKKSAVGYADEKAGKPIHTPCHSLLQLHLKNEMQLHRARGVPGLFAFMLRMICIAPLSQLYVVMRWTQ
jgi:hypothetical protein